MSSDPWVKLVNGIAEPVVASAVRSYLLLTIAAILVFGGAGYWAGQRSRNEEVQNLKQSVAARDELMNACFANGEKAERQRWLYIGGKFDWLYRTSNIDGRGNIRSEDWAISYYHGGKSPGEFAARLEPLLKNPQLLDEMPLVPLPPR